MPGRLQTGNNIGTSIINKVRSTLSLLKDHLDLTTTPLTNPSKTHFESPQNNPTQVGKLVLAKYYTSLCNNNDKVRNFNVSGASLNELLLRVSHVNPEISRKYLRVVRLKPEDVREILVGFDFGGGKLHDGQVVECLWEIFKRVGGEGNVGFKHFDESFEVMLGMLLGARMFREVERLVLSEGEGVCKEVSGEVLCGLIEGYVSDGELERAVFVYDFMKGNCLVPGLSCYRVLLGFMLKRREVDYARSVFEDMVEVEAGFQFGDVEVRNLEILVRLLCRGGKVNEARRILKKVVTRGWELSAVVLREVAEVYCAKKDYDDVLSLFAEMECVPDVLVGNKVISSSCSQFGIERAIWFLQELEYLGFRPNEKTFGILIGRSCLDGRLRNAFLFLSEMLAKDLKPDRHSYNAMIAGLFRAGMQDLAKHVLNEMVDDGEVPDLATFRALLAGYCKFRLFNEVKIVVREMVNRGFVSLSPLEDPISKAFSVLGLNPSTIKFKRDNDVKGLRAEFFDELGNGLYLETNLDEFERTLDSVLKESLIPDFNMLVTGKCDLENVKGALALVNEMVQWGQELSIPALSGFIKLLCRSKPCSKEISGILDENYQLIYQLDHEALNLLVQALSKKGSTEHSRLLIDEMHRRRLPISSVTYSAVLVGFFKMGNMSEVLHCWDNARKDNWLPTGKDFDTILGYLCQRSMLKEVLELFDRMVASNSTSQIQMFDVFLQQLCEGGFTEVGKNLVYELKQQNLELDFTVYDHLIKGCCQEKRFAEAVMIYDAIRDETPVLSLDSLLLLTPILCRAGRIDSAVILKDRYLEENHKGTSPSLYTALIDECCKMGKVAVADSLFMELPLKSIVPSDETYNSLLQGHCQIYDLRTVKEVLSVMLKRSITFSVSSCRDLLRLMCGKGMFEYALRLKRLMLVQTKFSHSVIFNLLISSLFQTGNCSLVHSLLHDAEEGGRELDQVGYNFLIHGYSICEDMPRATKYFIDMLAKGLKPSDRSFRAVVRYLCSLGEVQNALHLSDKMESKGWALPSTVQYALLAGLLSCGRIQLADRFLTQIMDKGYEIDPVIYDLLIQRHCSCGRIKEGVHLLNQVLKHRSIPSSASYNSLIQCFCAFTNLDRALDFLNEMLERNLKPNLGTWNSLIEKLCVSGRAKEAENLVFTMVRNGEVPTKQMYSSLINRYRSENNLSKASELLQQMQQHGYEPDFTTQWSLISSLISSNDRESSTSSQGFLSKLLFGSGLSSDSSAKSKLR